MSCKKTRLVPGNVQDEKVQIEFAEKIIALIEKSKTENIEVCFFDPTHQVHNTVNGYCWQEKGANHTKTVFSNSGRRRINIIGAINAATFKPTTIITEENCDKETVSVFLDEIKKDYSDSDRIYLFLDNAKYSRNYYIYEYAKKLNIELMFLPPYSPNLNLIERLWKFLKKKIRKNKYYKFFEEFKKTIYEFFENFEQYKPELKKLLTPKFEIIYRN